MVGSNVYHKYIREVTHAKRLVHGGKRWNCNGDESYKMICLAQYFKSVWRISCTLFNTVVNFSSMTVYWVEGSRDSTQDSGIARIDNQSC